MQINGNGDLRNTPETCDQRLNYFLIFAKRDCFFAFFMITMIAMNGRNCELEVSHGFYEKDISVFIKNTAGISRLFSCGMPLRIDSATGGADVPGIRRSLGAAAYCCRVAAAATGRQDRIWRDLLFQPAVDAGADRL